MNQQIIEHNKKVAEGWEREKGAKWDRIFFYFFILPSIFYLEIHIIAYIIKLLIQ